MIYELTIKRISNGRVMAEVKTANIGYLYMYIAVWKDSARLTDYRAYVNVFYNDNYHPGDIPDKSFSLYPMEVTLRNLRERCWQ